jgi:hypothetical protein
MSSFFSNQNTEPCTFHVCLLLFNEQKGTKNNGHSNYEERAQNFSRKCFSQAQRIITKLFFETNNYQTLPIRLASERGDDGLRLVVGSDKSLMHVH